MFHLYYVQFHIQPPKGWCVGIRVVSFFLTHPPAHKFTHIKKSLLAMTHLVSFNFCGFPCLIRDLELVRWQKYTYYPPAIHQPTYPDTRMNRQTHTQKHTHTCAPSLSFSLFFCLSTFSSPVLAVLHKSPKAEKWHKWTYPVFLVGRGFKVWPIKDLLIHFSLLKFWWRLGIILTLTYLVYPSFGKWLHNRSVWRIGKDMKTFKNVL